VTKKKLAICGCLVLFVFAHPQVYARTSLDAIPIGIILPITGDKAKFGEIEKKSFELAMQEINSSGGVNGRQVHFIFEDDTGRAEIAGALAEKLITKDKVVMLGGGYGGSETAAIAAVAEAEQVPFLVNTSIDDKITEKDWEYVFRLNAPASDYWAGVESFLGQVAKPKTATVIYENSPLGVSRARRLDETCKNLGIKLLLAEVYDPKEADYRPMWLRVRDADPDLVYMISQVKDASLLMRQAAEVDITPRLFLGGTPAFTHRHFKENAGKGGAMVFAMTLWHPALPYPGAQEYFHKFLDRFGVEPEYHGAQAYAAAHVMVDALKRAKFFHPEAIRLALTTANLMTVLGPVQFASYKKMSRQNRLPAYVGQWIDGTLELVWPPAVAEHTPVFPIDWKKARE
jgi:branched-chain amino acid transport system substrate-binding protein